MDEDEILLDGGGSLEPIANPSKNWYVWVAELNQVVGNAYGPRGPVGECGVSRWFDYWKAGYSPDAAFEADRTSE